MPTPGCSGEGSESYGKHGDLGHQDRRGDRIENKEKEGERKKKCKRISFFFQFLFVSSNAYKEK